MSAANNRAVVLNGLFFTDSGAIYKLRKELLSVEQSVCHIDFYFDKGCNIRQL